MAQFKIYGDYGYVSETLLEEFDSERDAVRWAQDYVDGGDFGGYVRIEVAYFAPNGEYVTVVGYDAEDYEDDCWYEGDDDFALDDDF
jgi:hypothetical protein